MELEDIVKYKKFIELNAEERKLVDTYVSNEEEYDNLRSFLLSTEVVYSKGKVNASEGLRTKVMRELHDTSSAKTIWYRSFFYFLFPENTNFLRSPALQLSVVAMAIFGFFFWFQSPIKSSDLAINKSIEQTEGKEPMIQQPEKSKSSELSKDRKSKEEKTLTKVPVGEFNEITEESESRGDSEMVEDISEEGLYANPLNVEPEEVSFDFSPATTNTNNSYTLGSGTPTVNHYVLNDSVQLFSKDVKYFEKETVDDLADGDYKKESNKASPKLSDENMTLTANSIEDKEKSLDSVSSINKNSNTESVVEIAASKKIRLRELNKGKAGSDSGVSMSKISVKSTSELLELFYEVK